MSDSWANFRLKGSQSGRILTEGSMHACGCVLVLHTELILAAYAATRCRLVSQPVMSQADERERYSIAIMNRA